MKKCLTMLLFLFPVGAFALTPVSDVTVTSDNTSIAFDQDGDALGAGNGYQFCSLFLEYI